jgi:predicted hotdog family 3-hydroxylacyl-ACP dehydratase
MMQASHTDISGIIPHRPPMVMIDQFTKKSETAGIGEKKFSQGNYGCENGFVLQTILIECVAQTVAAQHGYDQLSKDNPEPALGMLVTIDHFEFFHPVPENTSITIQVNKTDEIGQFHLIRGEILSGEKQMARGRIKIFNTTGVLE